MELRVLSRIAVLLGCLSPAIGASADPLAPVVPGSTSAAAWGTVTVSVPIGQFTTAESTRGDEITLEGFGYVNTPGEPRLPARIFSIAIPPGAEFLDLDVSVGEGILLPGAWDIAPANLPRVIGQEDPVLYQRDLDRCQQAHDAVYGSDDPYPQQIVEFVGTAGYREYNLVDVKVTPFSYHPVSGDLFFHDEVTINVRYRQGAGARATVTGGSERVRSMAREIVLNHDQAQGWFAGQAPGRGVADFVIITLDSLVESVQPIVDQEEYKGRTVEVVTTSFIESAIGGYDLAEKMRNFLREKYPADQWGIEDVLLVGDYDDVPIRRTAQDLGNGRPETDFYYAELSLPDDESWDADVDRQWGEDSDPIDFYAEVNVGRIPWSDSATVRSICEKTVAYEKNLDPSFKKNILLLGAFFWPDTDNAELMEAKVDQSWMADWTMTRLYEDGYSSFPMDYPISRPNVVSVWSSGTYAFVNWAGHGSPTSAHIYYTKGSAFIKSADCAQLNDDYPAIVFADACSNSDTDELNIGQSMLKQGAVAFLGATKVAYGMPGWNSAYDGSSQSMDYLFTTNVTSHDYTVGGAHQRALWIMYVYGLWGNLKYETFEWGALWGNPDLEMAAPPPLTIDFPEGMPVYLPPAQETKVTVRITEGAEAYVQGSGTLHYRYDGGDYLTSSLVPSGEALYEATLPGSECDGVPEYYFSAEGDFGSVIHAPAGAPDDVYEATVGIDAIDVADDFETDQGWTVEDQDVTDGSWERAVPEGSGGDRGDPEFDYDGSGVCFVTGNGFDQDLDGGPTHLISPTYDLTGEDGAYVHYARWFFNQTSDEDRMLCEVSNDDGQSWVLLEEVAHTEGWVMASFRVADYVTVNNQIRFRFSAADNPNDTVTEAGLDAFRISHFECNDPCAEDINYDYVVDINDVFGVVDHWGQAGGLYDVNDDGLVDIDDIFAVFAVWGPCP